MDANRLLNRRTFIADLGRGTLALAVVTLTGCAPSVVATLAPGGSSSPAPAPGGTGPGGAVGSTGAGSPAAGASVAAGQGLRWERVNLGFVSAYILVRGGEAVIVDTGTSGSADAIEASLTRLGLGWPAVGHMILTHNHSDHAGSAAEVLRRAPGAAGYAGAADIPSVTVPRPLKAVAEGDKVFDLTIVTAPGHTPGSICVFDPVAKVLVAGDAMGTSGGRPVLPGAQFTADMGQARQSIVKLGALAFETLLVGHGDPITSGASELVVELGKSG